MKTLFINLFFLSLIGYLLVAVLLYVFQRNFLYFPSAQYNHPYERISVLSQGETLDIIVLNKGQSQALMYFGGNAEAVVANAEEFADQFPGVTTYLVNYRGYGGSSGKPAESAIYADALAVYDHVKQRHDQISVAGRSLGSGVATYLATQRAIESVVLITPYDSVLSLAKSRYAIFPVKILLKDHYDSLSRVDDIQARILVIAAEHDEVIPMIHTQRLIDAIGKDRVVLKIINGSGHNDVSGSAEYHAAIRSFL